MPHDRPAPHQDGCTEKETNTTPAHRAHRLPARRARPSRPQVRERYHAITDQTVKVGYLTRHPGDALCGSAGPWADIPDGLFPPLVTCRSCQHLTATRHITITGSDT